MGEGGGGCVLSLGYPGGWGYKIHVIILFAGGGGGGAFRFFKKHHNT